MSAYRHCLLFLSAALITACGSDNPQKTETPLGKLSVAISDSPMFSLNAVQMGFSEISMLDSNNEAHRFALNADMFNLMAYQGSESYRLLDSLEIPIGNYHDVRLHSLDNGSIDTMSGQFSMSFQSGYIPVNDFVVHENQMTSLTVEVNLFRSMFQTDNGFQLMHYGVSTVNNTFMGHLSIDIDPVWIAECETEFSHLAAEGSIFAHMVYLYQGTDIPLEQMSDAFYEQNGEMSLPYVMHPLVMGESGDWQVRIGFLPSGEYSIGYSCLGHLDDPQLVDLTENQFQMYLWGGNLTINAGENGGFNNTFKMGGGHGGGSGMHGG